MPNDLAPGRHIGPYTLQDSTTLFPTNQGPSTAKLSSSWPNELWTKPWTHSSFDHHRGTHTMGHYGGNLLSTTEWGTTTGMPTHAKIPPGLSANPGYRMGFARPLAQDTQTSNVPHNSCLMLFGGPHWHGTSELTRPASSEYKCTPLPTSMDLHLGGLCCWSALFPRLQHHFGGRRLMVWSL